MKREKSLEGRTLCNKKTHRKEVNILRKRPAAKNNEDERRSLLRQSQKKKSSKIVRHIQQRTDTDKKRKILQFATFVDEK